MNFDIIMQNLQVGIMIAIFVMGVVMIFLTLMMYTMKATDVVMLILGKYFPEEKESEPVKVNGKEPGRCWPLPSAACLRGKRIWRH